ncbi:MAG: hypothetical protein ACK526_18860 [Planctomyces sp.]|jgi:hypothetical protein
MNTYRCPDRAKGQCGSQHRNGVVLIVVLVLVVMLSLAGFGFLSTMSAEYEAAKHQEEMLKGEQALASVEEMILSFAELSERQRSRLGGWKNNPNLFRGRAIDEMTVDISEIPVTAQEDNESTENSESGASGLQSPLTGEPSISESRDDRASGDDRRWRFSVTTTSAAAEQESVLQGEVIRFGLQNESSRINLHELLRWDQLNPGAGRKALMRLPGIDETIADSIMDWMDSDEQPREFGTESDFYLQLDHPYSCPNRPPSQLEELLFVRGVLRSHFYGGSTDPSRTDEALLSSLNQTDEAGNVRAPEMDTASSSQGWHQFLTCWSSERNSDRRGKPRTFLNMTDLSRLQTELSQLLSPEVARFAIFARQYGLSYPTGQNTSSGNLADVTPDLSVPGNHPIAAPASLIGAIVTVPSPSGSMVFASPIRPEDTDFAGQLFSLMDRTTTITQDQITGRINILEAHQLVLGSIPGMTDELLTQIIAQRDGSDAERQDTTWLLTEGLVDAAEFRRLSDYITAGGDVFRGDITVFRATGGPVLRRNAVFSGVTTPAIRLNWSLPNHSLPSLPVSLLMPRIP